MSEENTALNTDTEIWRREDTTGNGDFYEPSIHVTKGGSIVINVGEHVFVKPVEEWHRLAAEDAEASESAQSFLEELNADKEMMVKLVKMSAGVSQGTDRKPRLDSVIKRVRGMHKIPT